jgi:hypothetical protein
MTDAFQVDVHPQPVAHVRHWCIRDTRDGSIVQSHQWLSVAEAECLYLNALAELETFDQARDAEQQRQYESIFTGGNW